MVETNHIKLEEEKKKKHDRKAVVQEKIKLKHHPEENCEKRREKCDESLPCEP